MTDLYSFEFHKILLTSYSTNSIALIKAKIVYNFGLYECKRVKATLADFKCFIEK